MSIKVGINGFGRIGRMAVSYTHLPEGGRFYHQPGVSAGIFSRNFRLHG